MPDFIVYNATGTILRTGNCHDSDLENQAQAGELVMEGIANDTTQKIVNGVVVDKPPVVIVQPIFNLATAQLKKIEQLNVAYDRANTGTFKYLNVVYNGDAIAQSNFNSIANYINNFAAFPAGFPMAWLSADGGVLPLLTVSDFWPLYQAFVAQGVSNINRFATLKAQVLALPSTATQKNLDAIVW